MAKRPSPARKASKKSKAPATRRRRTAKAGANQETARLKRELSEALERQKATGEILAAISRSTFDLKTVLDTLVESAARLCDARYSFIFRHDGDKFRLVSSYGFSTEYRDWMKEQAIAPGRHTLVGRTAFEGRTVHIPDVLADADYTWGESIKRGNFRAMLGIPLMREGVPIGVIAACRPLPKPFTKKQIELVTTFADQAVIAIENVRLFDEVKARSNDLRESLQQQTATADVLKVISRSTFDLQAVLDTLVESATHLCKADHAWLFQRDGDLLRFSASFGHGTEVHTRLRDLFLSREARIDKGSIVGRSTLEGRVVHVADVLADPEYQRSDVQQIGGYRAALGAPLLRDGKVIGVIFVAKTRPEPFSTKQIELVTTFADQAVIAIENARLFEEVKAKTENLAESLQQQTATADVLKVISRSKFDLRPVLDTLVDTAARLCETDQAFIFRRDGDVYRLAANHGFSAEYAEWIRQNPPAMTRGSTTGRTVIDKKIVHIPDVLADPDYQATEHQSRGGYRTVLGVPLLRGDEAIGVFTLAHRVVKPFTEKQIELITTFADQAVIAIENVRLFEDLQARTRDLAESLEQQTATSEVLGAISSSLEELAPLFQKVLENAVRVCGARFGTMNLYDGEKFDTVAGYNVPREYTETQLNRPFVPHPKSGLGTIALTRRPVHIEDIRTQPPYLEGNPAVVGISDIAGARTLAIVPMLKEDTLVGTLAIYRQEVNPFSEKQIALLSNFAQQAVIAIENNRLLMELRGSLQQQTATADVLKLISRSAFDLPTVLQTLIESAARLCDADKGSITRQQEGTFYRAEFAGFSQEFIDYVRQIPVKPDRGTAIGRALFERTVVHIPDVTADPDYTFTEGQKIGDYRSLLCVPMLREEEALGVFLLTRAEVRPFTEKQIELAMTFADQAAIAIENVRLFEEVQSKTRDLSEALVHQTGSEQILRVIASSPTSVEPVFNAIVKTTCELCDAYDAILRLKDGDQLVFSAHHGNMPINSFTVPIHRERTAGRALLEKRSIHVHDLLSADGDEYPPTQQDARKGNFHTLLCVPLLRENEGIGVISLRRLEIRPFSDKQIKLLQTFADQAVIAIGNVRMFEQVQQRTRELSRSLEDLRTAQDRLIQTEKLASLGQLTAGIAHEIKNPLNFINNFSALSVELVDELDEALKPVPLDDKTRESTDELARTLKGNLEKVVQHGKRADSIVKNMLLHSREGTGERRAVDINALVAESLNLAYHGARAEKGDFQIRLDQNLDPAAGEAEVVPQEITRVLLNLISNGFYAATKRKAAGGHNGFEPALSASTRSLGDRVEVRIRDNGSGIAPEVKEKMFNPFFTTKPAGEGTGLGLSLSHDIVVKQHGGSIEVDTSPGEFTEFCVVLPRIATPAR